MCQNKPLQLGLLKEWQAEPYTLKQGKQILIRVARHLRLSRIQSDKQVFDTLPYSRVFHSVLCGTCKKYKILCQHCHTCNECCQCPTCAGCDQKADGLCGRCNYCRDGCCECSYCEHCSEPVESICDECNRCTDCCGCVRCRNSRCNRVSENICSRCEQCMERCCECSTCDSCGERCDNTCGECDRCSDCCNCDKGPRANQRFKFNQPSDISGFKRNRMRRAIALEVEISSVDRNGPLEEYASDTGAGLSEDGSIPDAGCEIQTNPASGDNFLSDISALNEALEQSGADVDSSCGFHVHVDASDYNQYDLRKFMLVWIAVEPAMFELVTKDRIIGSYCKPCGQLFANILTGHEGTDGKNWRQRLAAGLYLVGDYKKLDKSIKTLKSTKWGDQRYLAVNLHSFFVRKSIEYRLHESTVKPDVILNWPLVCANLIEYAFRHTEADILALLRREALTAEDILLACLPACLQTWVTGRLETRRTARNRYDTNSQVLEAMDQLSNARSTIRDNNLVHDTKETICAE